MLPGEVLAEATKRLVAFLTAYQTVAGALVGAVVAGLVTLVAALVASRGRRGEALFRRRYDAYDECMAVFGRTIEQVREADGNGEQASQFWRLPHVAVAIAHVQMYGTPRVIRAAQDMHEALRKYELWAWRSRRDPARWPGEGRAAAYGHAVEAHAMFIQAVRWEFRDLLPSPIFPPAAWFELRPYVRQARDAVWCRLVHLIRRDGRSMAD